MDTETVPASREAVGPFTALWRVVVCPGATFEALTVKPRWVLPVALWVLVGGLSPLVIGPRVDFEPLLRRQFAARGIALGDDRIAAIAENARKPRAITVAAGAVGGVVVPIIICSAVWSLFRLSGSECRFSVAFAITSHAAVPVIASHYAQLAVAAGRESFDVDEAGNLLLSNLMFLVNEASPAWLRSLAQSADLYTVISVSLLSLGFTVATGRRVRVSAFVVAGTWAAWVGAMAVVASLTG